MVVANIALGAGERVDACVTDFTIIDEVATIDAVALVQNGLSSTV